MQEFLNIILSFPAVGFTILLGFVIVYWLFVLLGALDLDLFDLDADIDADVDIDLDADVDVDVDTDVDVDGDVDATGAGVFVSILSALGWVGVPLTITISFFTLLNWICTFLGTYFLAKYLGEGFVPILKIGVFFGSIVASTFMTSIAIKPLKGIFRSAVARAGAEAFIGKTLTVSSANVTPIFGRGAFNEADGAVMELSIRCETKNNGLGRGDEALIIDYDAEKHVYFVEPMGQMLGNSTSGESLDVVFDNLERESKQESVNNKP